MNKKNLASSFPQIKNIEPMLSVTDYCAIKAFFIIYSRSQTDTYKSYTPRLSKYNVFKTVF